MLRPWGAAEAGSLDAPGVRRETFAADISARLRSTALALPATSEGSSCVNRAFTMLNAWVLESIRALVLETVIRRLDG